MSGSQNVSVNLTGPGTKSQSREIQITGVKLVLGRDFRIVLFKRGLGILVVENDFVFWWGSVYFRRKNTQDKSRQKRIETAETGNTHYRLNTIHVKVTILHDQIDIH